MKILIKDHRPSEMGGIANFYRMLTPYLGKDVEFAVYSCPKNNWIKFVFYLWDIIDFTWRLCFGKYDAVIVNPPFYLSSIRRDSAYCFVTKRIFRKKLFVFWHGWNEEAVKNVREKRQRMFRRCYEPADGMFVLANRFKEELLTLNYPTDRIHVVTTVVEDDIFNIPHHYKTEPPFTVLFLSMILRAKGVFVFLDTAAYIQVRTNAKIDFVIAGDGPDLNEAKQYAKDHRLNNVRFSGYVRGKVKSNLLTDSDIWILPSSHHEGLPCALLEAMAAGLPVLTTAVGGIPDFFENGKMGQMTEQSLPEIFANYIVDLYKNPAVIEKIGTYNRAYAEDHFKASNVAQKILNAIHESGKSNLN